MKIQDLIYENYCGILSLDMNPKFIYLGYEEMLELKKWADFTRNVVIENNKPMEYLGMKIYEVNIKNHFNVTGVPELRIKK